MPFGYTDFFYVKFMINFTLVSHADKNGVQVQGAVHRTEAKLSVWYQLHDVKNQVELADILPTRQDELWQQTCFELFYGIQGSPKYWEVNITPSGAWNVYAFSSSRTGMRQEEKIKNVASTIYKSSDSIILHCSFDIDKILPKHCIIDVGVSCVVAFKNCEKGYWALAHNKDVPDFHDRSAFLLHI